MVLGCLLLCPECARARSLAAGLHWPPLFHMCLTLLRQGWPASRERWRMSESRAEKRAASQHLDGMRNTLTGLRRHSVGAELRVEASLNPRCVCVCVCFAHFSCTLSQCCASSYVSRFFLSLWNWVNAGQVKCLSELFYKLLLNRLLISFEITSTCATRRNCTLN